MSDLSNKTIGQYQIEKLLGQGGMGAVYRARDVQLQRLVAFKMMHPEIAAHDDLRKRFLQEARAIAALDHPNIIRVYSFVADEELYLVMEYVPGGSLRDYLKKLQKENKFLEIEEAIDLVKQLAAALQYAHDAGMVHRDVKPDNVLLKVASGGSGGVHFNGVLTDFGLAKLAENAVVQTAGHNPMGTLPYMPPEQIRGEKTDGRTDLYALGIMMYELLVGKLPFMPRNIPEAARMHGSDDPPSPSAGRPGISKELEAIILKCLAKHPNDRYQTGNELIEAIETMEAKAQADQPDEESYLATYIDPGQLDSKKEDSLRTYLASMPGVPDIQDMKVPDAPADLRGDQLVIMRKGYAAQTIPINSLELMIGRDPTHAVSLQGEKVSRNHARIERRADGSYTITDLGSTNGTYLDEAKLLSNVTEPWDIGQVVSVGDFRITVQQATIQKTQVGVKDVGTLADIRPAAGIAPRQSMQTQPQIQGTSAGRGVQIGIQVLPPNVTVDAGGQQTAQVEITNTSDIVEHYRAQIQGIPSEWFTSPNQTLQLLPGNKGLLPLVFHPPRNPKSSAGTHNFSLRISSEERGQEIARGAGMLTIKPFFQYAVEMEPKRLRRKGMLRFVLINQGNAPDSYTVYGRDREEGLHFFPPTATGTVGAGLSDALEFEVRPRRGNLIGISKTYPFEIAADAASGMNKQQNGELVHAPFLPIWLLMLLLLLCLACLALLALLYFNRDEPAPQSFDAVTATNQEIRDLLTATAEDFVQFQEDRIATATAVAGLDEDRDGLTTAQEIELGTDPSLADTDGDGLEDGEEVNEYESDPLKADTDGDGLNDGDEIDNGSDPTKADTDSDGLNDAEEVLTYKTDPTEKDSDGDTLRDGVEVLELNTDPTKVDTDGDGRTDNLDSAPTDPSIQ